VYFFLQNEKNFLARVYYSVRLVHIESHYDMPATKKRISACRKHTADQSKACSVPMPAEMQAAIIRRAQAEDRSFSAVVRRALAAYLAQ
jgi:hypothetical protein